MGKNKPHLNNKIPTERSLLEKIVVNAGIGRLSSQPNFEEKILPQIARDLSLVTGQKPEVCRARKSIAGFKTREGQIVGLRVTLRRQKMVDFFERLIRIVLPRVRDFNGLNISSIDEHGTLNIGLKEQFVFPEVNPEESALTFSLGLNIVPKMKHRSKVIEVYREFGVPLKKK
ncbi:MAG: 50S ribosomal protein L5 [Candidatus Liptonbacteria bacterium]|nr:50S ribosomal protein L5 [Candidatus Liptonbacteria bacterium]